LGIENLETMFSLKTIIWLLVFLLFSHIVATVYHLYWLFPWFDIPMHFLGGFLLAIIFFYLWRFAHISIGTGVSPAPPRSLAGLPLANVFVALVLTLGFVALIGVLWEFYEFLHDFYFLTGGKINVFQTSFANTIKDLFFDLVGGITAFAIFYKSTNN